MQNRARPDFSKRSKQPPTINISTVSYYRQTVQRNVNFYNHIISRNCILKDLHVYVESMSTPLSQFVFRVSVFSTYGDLHQYDFPVNNIGISPFVDQHIPLLAGDRVTFDIQKIDSVYQLIAAVGIGFTLDYG